MALFARGDWDEVLAALVDAERQPDDNNIQIWWAISAMIGSARGTEPPLAVGRLERRVDRRRRLGRGLAAGVRGADRGPAGRRGAGQRPGPRGRRSTSIASPACGRTCRSSGRWPST